MFLTQFLRGIFALIGCRKVCMCVYVCWRRLPCYTYMHKHICSRPSVSSKVGLLNDPREGRSSCLLFNAIKKKRKHGKAKGACVRDRDTCLWCTSVWFCFLCKRNFSRICDYRRRSSNLQLYNCKATSTLRFCFKTIATFAPSVHTTKAFWNP